LASEVQHEIRKVRTERSLPRLGVAEGDAKRSTRRGGNGVIRVVCSAAPRTNSSGEVWLDGCACARDERFEQRTRAGTHTMVVVRHQPFERTCPRTEQRPQRRHSAIGHEDAQLDKSLELRRRVTF
jgi:hypothetical protein